MSAAFNTRAERLGEVVGDLQVQNARQDALLDSMGYPVLTVNDQLEVTYMNADARNAYPVAPEGGQGRPALIMVVRQVAVEELARKALQEGKIQRGEVALGSGEEERVLRVVASPIHSDREPGVILTLSDVTEAVQLQRMRAEFVANVTHELKTPLTSIRGFVDTLRQGAIAQPEVAGRFLDIIDIEAERLYQLIRDTLSLSEIEEAPQDAEERETFDLVEAVEEVEVLLDEEAQARGVVLRAPEGSLPVTANRGRIKQLLLNLMDNGIKYNRPGGTLSVAAQRQEDGMVEIRVSDTGEGIAAEHLGRLFERFYRVDKSRSRALGGTGLGLSIVKHIAQLYHGVAQVTSTVGQGTTFIIRMEI